MKLPRFRWWWLPLTALALVPLGGAWLLGTEGGLRGAVAVAQDRLASQLEIRGARGTLAGPLQFQSIHFRNDKVDIELREVELQWKWHALPGGELIIDRLDAQSLHIATAASTEAPALPATLAPPLALRVAQLNIGRIVASPYQRPHDPAAGAVIAESVAVSIDADGRRIRAGSIRATSRGMRLAGNAEIAAQTPFGLQADAELSGNAGGHAVALKAKANGTLAAIEVTGSADGEGVSGSFNSRIAPFSRQMVGRTQATFKGIDPSLLFNNAPRAMLVADLALQQVANRTDAYGGHLKIGNAKPGRVDEGLLPVRELAANLAWSEGVLDIAGLRVDLHEGGMLAGSGRYAAQQLALALQATDVNAASLHRSAKPTKLTGPVGAVLSLNRQQLKLDVQDPRFRLASDVSIAYPDVALENLTLSRGSASLSASGKVALAGARAFALTGRLEKFDPAAFANVPAALLNAELSAAGSLGDQPNAGLQFTLGESRYAGQPLSGAGKFRYTDGVVPEIDIHLLAAGNRLDAAGAWGRPGNTLNIRIDAPKLDPLGLQGDLFADVAISGSRALPVVQGSAHSKSLSWPGRFAIRGAQFGATFGKTGDSAARVRFSLDTAEAAAGRLEALAISLDGTPELHTIGAGANINGLQRAQLTLKGGVRDMEATPSWSGSLTRFTLNSTATVGSTDSIVALAAPAPIAATTASFAAGPLELRGTGWTANVQKIAHQAGTWMSRGELRGLPVKLFVDAPLTTLTIGGEWDLTFGEHLRGRVQLAREAGDIIIATDDVFDSSAPESRISMGMQAARLEMQAVGNRATASLQLSGLRLGEVTANLAAQLGADTAASHQLPWSGALKIRTPDLAWASVLVGDGIKIGGRLEGGITLAGTPAAPRVDGQFSGTGLALSTRQQGINLRDGRMQLDLKDDRLFVRELKFQSPHQPPPAALANLAPRRIAELVKTPGTLEVSGESRLGDERATIDLRMDRVGVMQRNDQWVVLSGDGKLNLEKRTLAITGNLRADATWWELPKRSSIALSDDVVFKKRETVEAAVRPTPLRTRLNLDIRSGELSYFRGAGLESRLAGSVKLTSELGHGLRAHGIIEAVSGKFDAYGQRLDIERGLINFAGLVDNPGLNIRAMRRKLPVEAGVEVTGTAQRPRIRLVSDPNVPDVEKLSWLVQGRAPDQGSSRDSEMLIAAATSILGGDGGVVTELQRKLGIDEFGIGSGTLDSGQGRGSTSRVATTGASDTGDSAGTQIVTVGKRLSENTFLTYEQSIATAESIVKLTVNLSNRLSLVARSGTENALDLYYSFRFGKSPPPR